MSYTTLLPQTWLSEFWLPRTNNLLPNFASPASQQPSFVHYFWQNWYFIILSVLPFREGIACVAGRCSRFVPCKAICSNATSFFWWFLLLNTFPLKKYYWCYKATHVNSSILLGILWPCQWLQFTTLMILWGRVTTKSNTCHYASWNVKDWLLPAF